MAVRIRLTRVGATKRPAYRVIAIDRRRSRDGRALEILGFYDPLTDPATVRLETDRIKAWIGKGAQPSDTVARLIRLAEQPPDATRPKPKRATRSTKSKAAAKADAPAAEPAARSATAEAPAAEEAPAREAPATEDSEPVAEESGSGPAAGPSDAVADAEARPEQEDGDTTERAEA